MKSNKQMIGFLTSYQDQRNQFQYAWMGGRRRSRRKVVPRHAAQDRGDAAERDAVVGVEDDSTVIGEGEDYAVGEEVENG